MQVRIDQHGMPAHPYAEMPGQIDRYRGRADPATHPGDRNGPAAMHAVRAWCLTRDDRTEMSGHLVARQRLGQVLGRTEAAGDLAIELETVALADHKDAHIRLDNVRQLGERAQRFFLAADV